MATSSRTPRIFISHNHNDNAFGIRLVDDLCRAIGDESAVWYDSRGGLKGGDVWWTTICKELKRRNTFIVVLSPYSLKAPWVRKEMRMALMYHVQRNQKIIPVLYQPCKIPDDFQDIQAISFLPNKTYEEAFQELEEALQLSKYVAGTQNVSSLGDYRRDKMQQLVQEVEVAYHKDDWVHVIEKVHSIAHQYPDTILPSLYCMQGWAYYFENQPALAREALEKGSRLIYNTPKRLALLEDMRVAQLVSNGQWSELLTYADEELRLDPHNPTWRMAKDDALERIHQTKPAFSEQAFSPGRENGTEVPVRNVDRGPEKDDVATADKQSIHLIGNSLKKADSDQQLKEIELQKQKLNLQKERFQFEKEQMSFAFEVSERLAGIYTGEDSTTKTMLLRAFLPDFLSVEDEGEN